MKRKIVFTDDGSTTIHLETWNEHYHSKHGAIREAYHVFIKNGLFHLPFSEITILEMGFGTGLNALITYLEAEKNRLKINYVGMEAFPVTKEELDQLNFATELGETTLTSVFAEMHATPWEQSVTLSNFFSLHKQKQDFLSLRGHHLFNLVYFDAFGPRVQPELWTEEVFEKTFRVLKDSGVLVTYSAKGSVRRAMQNVGFTVERLPGPPGKREMLRATKNLKINS